jgi:hypothetical protein
MRSRRRMKTVPKYVSVGIRDWVQQTYLSIRVKGRVDAVCEPKLGWIVDQFGRFVLVDNLVGTYAIGLPAAVGFGLLASFGFFGVFAAKVLEEVVKATCFFLRFRGVRWYASALKEEEKAESTSTSES